MRAAIVAGAACPRRPDFLLGFAIRVVRRWGLKLAVDEDGREWLVNRRCGVRLLKPGEFEVLEADRGGFGYPTVRPIASAGRVSLVSEVTRGGRVGAVGHTATPQGVSTATGLGISPSTERGRVAAQPQHVPILYTDR